MSEHWTVNVCPRCRKLLSTWPSEEECRCEPVAIGHTPDHLRIEVLPSEAIEKEVDERVCGLTGKPWHDADPDSTINAGTGGVGKRERDIQWVLALKLASYHLAGDFSFLKEEYPAELGALAAELLPVVEGGPPTVQEKVESVAQTLSAGPQKQPKPEEPATKGAGMSKRIPLTRDDVVLIASALEEFRDEYGPGEREKADRVREVLRGTHGDNFALVHLDEQEVGE